MSDNIVHVTDSSFEEDVLKSDCLCWLISGLSGVAHVK